MVIPFVIPQASTAYPKGNACLRADFQRYIWECMNGLAIHDDLGGACLQKRNRNEGLQPRRKLQGLNRRRGDFRKVPVRCARSEVLINELVDEAPRELS